MYVVAAWSLISIRASTAETETPSGAGTPNVRTWGMMTMGSRFRVCAVAVSGENTGPYRDRGKEY